METGMHFEDSRIGTIYTVVFYNSDVLLFKDANNYRLDSREYFENCMEQGRFEPVDFDEDSIPEGNPEIPLQEIDLIGETASESLRTAGLKRPEDFLRTADEKILECRGVGEKGLENIMKYIEKL